MHFNALLMLNLLCAVYGHSEFRLHELEQSRNFTQSFSTRSRVGVRGKVYLRLENLLVFRGGGHEEGVRRRTRGVGEVRGKKRGFEGRPEVILIGIW